jgi:2-oxoglutarate ferredoxin oxidoreductase subunit gamma
MAMHKQVRVCGFGGQGVILIGAILGYAGMLDGKWAAGSDSYGVQARGGYCRSDIVLSDIPIVYPHVLEADVLVALSQDAYDKYTGELAPDAVVLYEDQFVRPRPLEGATQVGIPATAIALGKLDRKQAANMVMLGATVEITKVVEKQALFEAVRANMAPRHRALTMKALEEGFKIGSERCPVR